MARHDYERTPDPPSRPEITTTHPPLPQRAMAETTLNKKMRAFDDEVALTVAPFYVAHMLQRTLPTGIHRAVSLNRTSQTYTRFFW